MQDFPSISIYRYKGFPPPTSPRDTILERHVETQIFYYEKGFVIHFLKGLHMQPHNRVSQPPITPA